MKFILYCFPPTLMPPLSLSSSRHNSNPRICAIESLLSLPVRDTVKPMVRMSSAASAGEAVSNAAAAIRTSLLMVMASSQESGAENLGRREQAARLDRTCFPGIAFDVDQILGVAETGSIRLSQPQGIGLAHLHGSSQGAQDARRLVVLL